MSERPAYDRGSLSMQTPALPSSASCPDTPEALLGSPPPTWAALHPQSHRRAFRLLRAPTVRSSRCVASVPPGGRRVQQLPVEPMHPSPGLPDTGVHLAVPSVMVPARGLARGGAQGPRCVQTDTCRLGSQSSWWLSAGTDGPSSRPSPSRRAVDIDLTALRTPLEDEREYEPCLRVPARVKWMRRCQALGTAFHT